MAIDFNGVGGNDIFNKASGNTDELMKNMLKFSENAGIMSKAIDMLKSSSAKHAEALYKEKVARDMQAVLDNSGAKSKTEQINVMRKFLSEETTTLLKSKEMTMAKGQAIASMTNAMSKLPAKALGDSIETVGKKTEGAIKAMSGFMSGTVGAAGSERGFLVDAPVAAMKSGVNILGAAGEKTGNLIAGIGKGIMSVGMMLGPVGAVIGTLVGGLAMVVGNGMASASKAMSSAMTGIIDAVGGMAGQLVDLAIKVRNYYMKVTESMREAERGFGTGYGNLAGGESNYVRKMMAQFKSQSGLALSSQDAADMMKNMAKTSFGSELLAPKGPKGDLMSTLSDMEAMKRTMGMSDYGFFGFLTRMSSQSTDIVMGNTRAVFEELRKTAASSKISLADMGKAFTETTMSGKKYLVGELENFRLIRNFAKVKDEFKSQGVDIVADMTKIIQNFQSFGDKLSDGQKAYFGMTGMGGTDAFSGMLKFRYGQGAAAEYVGGTNQIRVTGDEGKRDNMEARVMSLVKMAEGIQTGNAEQDIFTRTKMFMSNGLDQGTAEILAQKMDSVFDKGNEKTLDQMKKGAMTSKEQMSTLITANEQHNRIQEGLMQIQVQLMTTMIKFAMLSALSGMALAENAGMGFSGARDLAKKMGGEVIADFKSMGTQYLAMFKQAGVLNMLQANGVGESLRQFMVMMSGGEATKGAAASGKKHFGGYIERFHDGGDMSPFKGIVKENEAMFLGRMGASVVPERNINILTNEKLSSLIQGSKTDVMTSAMESVVSAMSPAGSGGEAKIPDVNVTISGSVFSMNDFKKIIKDTVMEVLGGR